MPSRGMSMIAVGGDPADAVDCNRFGSSFEKGLHQDGSDRYGATFKLLYHSEKDAPFHICYTKKQRYAPIFSAASHIWAFCIP